jgi:hypothetical protein
VVHHVRSDDRTAAEAPGEYVSQPVIDPILALAEEADRRTDQSHPKGGLALARRAVRLAATAGKHGTRAPDLGSAVAELADALQPDAPGDRWP